MSNTLYALLSNFGSNYVGYYFLNDILVFTSKTQGNKINSCGNGMWKQSLLSITFKNEHFWGEKIRFENRINEVQ